MGPRHLTFSLGQPPSPLSPKTGGQSEQATRRLGVLTWELPKALALKSWVQGSARSQWVTLPSSPHPAVLPPKEDGEASGCGGLRWTGQSFPCYSEKLSQARGNSLMATLSLQLSWGPGQLGSSFTAHSVWGSSRCG